MNLPLECYYGPSFSIVDRYSIYPTAMSLGTAEEHRTRRHTREDGAGGTGPFRKIRVPRKSANEKLILIRRD